MVSIQRLQAGGMSFSSSHSHDSDQEDSDHHPSDNGSHDDASSDNRILCNRSLPWETKKVNTVWVGVVQIVITIALLYVAAVTVTVECSNSSGSDHSRKNSFKYEVLCYVPSVSLIMYLQSFLWGLFLICDQYIQYEHIKARRRGYLEFYNESRTLSQIPFFIVSAWCSLLLAVSMVLNDNCKSADHCGQLVHLGKAEYAILFVALEGTLIIVTASIYMFKVYRFNKTGAMPDVLKEEYMSVATDYSPNNFGLIDEEIFQRQADVIRYLSEHNVMLRRKVMELNHQLMEHSHSV